MNHSYKVKKLINGGAFGADLAGKQLVAVPDNKDEVYFGNKLMVLDSKPLTCRYFEDQFKEGKYRMCYWEWKPLEGVALDKYLYNKSFN